MDLYKLIDKNGQIQVSIVRYLLDHDLNAKITKIVSDLSISRFVFDTNFEELITILDRLDIGLKVELNDEYNAITLTKRNDTCLDKFYFHYLSHSLDYMIILYIYKHPNYSITKLCEQLALAEATVYRRINKINELLEEFEIQIKRGKIVGSELQICFFFFSFFYLALPLEEFEERATDQSTLRFINYLEKQLQQPLSSNARVKLYLCVRILKRRFSAQTDDLSAVNPIITEFLATQKNDKLYNTIREAYYLSMSQFAFFGSENRSIYLYLFLSSLFILEPDNPFFYEMGYWPTTNPKIIKLNRTVVDYVKNSYHIATEAVDPSFIRNWKYILTQIHGSIYYFRGNVTFFSESVIHNQLLTTVIHTPDYQLAYEIVSETEDLLGRNIEGTTKQAISRVHLYFVNEMRKYSQKNLKIGLSYSRDYLQISIMMQTLKYELGTKYPIVCEFAKPDVDYDLLISDSNAFLHDFTYKEVYIINSFKTSADTRIIMSLLTQLLSKEGYQ